MRDFLFQIVLFLAGAFIGVTVPLLRQSFQRLIAGLLAVVLIAVSLLWAVIELGSRQPLNTVAVEDRPGSLRAEPTNPPVQTIEKAVHLNPAIPPSPTPGNTIEPTATRVPMPTATAKPVPTAELFDTGNEGIKVSTRPGSGRVFVTFSAGGKPIHDFRFFVQHILENIVGDLVWDGSIGGRIDTIDVNGSSQFSMEDLTWGKPATDGLYGLLPFDWKGFRDANWGYTGNGPNEPYEIYGWSAMFPLASNRDTYIDVAFAVLEVGVVTTQNKALTRASVTVGCQMYDISGEIIREPDFNHCKPSAETDEIGLARFILAPGKYFVGASRRYNTAIQYLDGVQLGPGEVKRIIIMLSKD